MKKIIALTLSLTLVFLLSACGEQPKDINESTAGSTDNSATTSSSKTETEETTLSTEGQDTPAVVTPEEVFYNLINTGLYRRALGCTFEKPEDVPVWFYFYLGVSDKEVRSQPLTDEEYAFAENVFGKALEVCSVTKLPVSEINKDLSILGVTVEDIQIPDEWEYYDKTDAYYFCVSDAYGVGGHVTKVEQGTEGIVAVYWEKKGTYVSSIKQPIPGRVNDGKVKMVMTLQLQSDGTYRVLSNLPQE